MNKDDLTIYPIKIDESVLNEVEKYPLPNIPFFMCIVGRVRAGKTLLSGTLCHRSEPFYADDFQVKILISTTARNDALMKPLIDSYDFFFDTYSDHLLEEIVEMVENDPCPNRYLLVLDDVITSGFSQSKSGKTDYFTSLITRYRHIANLEHEREGMLSIILCVQYFKYLTPITRSNCSGLIIAGDIADQEIGKIAEAYDFITGSSQNFLKHYKECRKEPYDFCYCNINKLEMSRNFGEAIFKKDLLKVNQD
tara:strand:+ start:1786 stop:2541 length:756 start_codon:yes stop_codon:yes gene_type:complete